MAVPASGAVDDLAYLEDISRGLARRSLRSGREALEINRHCMNILITQVTGAVPDHLAHGAERCGPHTMAGFQVLSDRVERPGTQSARRRRQVCRGPRTHRALVHRRDLIVHHFVGDFVKVVAAGQRLGIALPAEKIPRRVTGTAMAETLGEIGTAVPLG